MAYAVESICMSTSVVGRLLSLDYGRCGNSDTLPYKYLDRRHESLFQNAAITSLYSYVDATVHTIQFNYFIVQLIS